MTIGRVGPVAVAVLAAVVALGGTSPRAAAADEFPAGWEGFHTYDEMVADVQAVAAAHPDIVSLSSIGTSYQGRTLWAAKVSDDVADGRARAGGPLRRPAPRARAHVAGDDPQDPPLAGRRLRLGPARHGHRGWTRGLDHLRGQPRWRRVRHQGRRVPPLAEEPPADARVVQGRHRPQPQLRLPLGLLWRLLEQPGQPPVSWLEALLGAGDAGRPRLRARAASSAAGSRSGRTSPSTPRAGS